MTAHTQPTRSDLSDHLRLITAAVMASIAALTLIEAPLWPLLLLRLPWATHGCDAHFGGPTSQLSTYAIERFLAAVT